MEFVETWQLRKPAAIARHGLVTSQHHLASGVGAGILADGGNAVDAAIATSLAIGTVEPWMSGLGGGGAMLVYWAAEDRYYFVDCGMVSPSQLKPQDYPLVPGDGADLFGWPNVLEDRNLHGYHAIAVPGLVAGLDLAARRFGSLPWADYVAPAIELANKGMLADWYAGFMITTAARILQLYQTSKDTYLPGGFPLAGDWGGTVPRFPLGELSATLQHLAGAGAADFYHGDLARSIVADLNAGGNAIGAEDLSRYQASITEVTPVPYRRHHIATAGRLTAGPSLLRALDLLSASWQPPSGIAAAAPDAEAYGAYAQALLQAYAERLTQMGDSDETRTPSCTTHITAIDAQGNIVALTQTLLSLFGSKVMLPSTGMMMNNGIMWFDPRPGGPNAIRPGKKPLSNMCPSILRRQDGQHFGLGASGGRRIMPAVLQLLSFLADYEMDLEAAAHQCRLDVSGSDEVTLDPRMDPAIHARLARQFNTRIATHGVYPAFYACPNAVGQITADQQAGIAYIYSPWAKAVAADEFT